MASVFDRLLTACGTVVSNLALSVNGTACTVRVRRLPAKQFSADGLPIILVAASPRPEESRLFDTGTTQDVTYAVQIVLLAASDRALAAGTGSTAEDVMEAREALRRAFQRPTLIRAAGITECLITTVLPDAPLARGKWGQNLDATGITVRFRCEEPATN